MQKVTITIELPITGQAERVTVRGPLIHRDLCLQMIEDAAAIVRNLQAPTENAVIVPAPNEVAKLLGV